MNNYAVIVAGGSGSRMKSDQPKQFLALAGRPLLMHTIEAFERTRLDISILLVLPEDHIDTWKALTVRHQFDIPHQIVSGGLTRFNSVENGLNEIVGAGIVAIHDGARPLVTPDIIRRTFDKAEGNGSGVAAVKVKDSIRRLTQGQSRAVDRNEYFAVQTPQTFDLDLIKKAFVQAQNNQFTDDASVLEAYGQEITLVEGAYDNIKITTPEDLIMAEAILSSRQ